MIRHIGRWSRARWIAIALTASAFGSGAAQGASAHTLKNHPSVTSRAASATVLREGMRSTAVRSAQWRLSTLGYYVGAVNGYYGPQTTQGVMALQKAAELDRDGVLGPDTSSALSRQVRPRPRTTTGSAVEVDLGRQLVLVVVSGRLRYVLNTSTGSGLSYASEGHQYLAVTPRGQFSVEREIDGLRVSPLGELWRPKYFTGGYALHGSPSVPGYPASHGCVRLTNAAIDMLWWSGTAPLGRRVWVY
jgi:N-acetylmuramoyl-L-alanine amidase